jgi:hypothetical protein
MPTEFDRQFSVSGFPQMLTTFGEPLIYLPAGGGRRCINGIVERNPPASYDTAGNVVIPELIIRVANSCTLGIQSTEVDTGGDRVEVIKKIGEVVPSRFQVRQMQSQDSGVTVLAVM